MMNMTEIATTLGVSQSTVSRVLNNRDKGRVSPKTAEMIREYIRSSGFVRNNQASTLRTGKSNVMGLILPWNVPELMDTIERECAAEGMNLLVQFTPEPNPELEQKAVDVMLEQQVDSLIWEPYMDCDINLIERAARGIPHVAFLGDHPGLRNVVRFDYTNGLRKIFHHAVKNSYFRIVIVGFVPGTAIAVPECREIDRSLSLFVLDDFSGEQLQALLTPNTLLVGWNDWHGLALFDYLQNSDWSVPRDIGIVVVGDLLLGNRFRMGDIFRHPFTSLNRDFAAMARAAVKRVVLGQNSTEPIYIDMELQIRNSSVRR